MRAGDLSEPERGLWMGFPYGTHIDLCDKEDPMQNDPAHAESWGEERCIRAEVIKDLLVGRRPVDPRQENGKEPGSSPAVFVSGARITGQLDLRGIEFAPPLLLQRCAFEKPLIITDSIARSIRLYDCYLPGVQGAWLKCTGDLHLRGCQIEGEVDLGDAFIGGQLVLSRSKLVNPGGIAVQGRGLVVVGDVFCRDRAEVTGEFCLVAARIGGELRLTDSLLRNPGGIAFNAERIAVEKDVYCREKFRAEGEVRLAHGQIRGQLNFNHATLVNPQGIALNGDHLVVDSHLYCQDGFETCGEVNLVAARVGGEVRFSAATLHNPGRTALRAERLNVGDDMYCRNGLTVRGEVSLWEANINGQLNFNDSTLHNPGQVALRGDRLVIGSHLYCQDGFVCDGEIRLVAAWVGGEIRFSASTLTNIAESPDASAADGESRAALLAERLTVVGDMYCREGLTVRGAVSLRGAHINGQLNFNTSKLYNAGRIALLGDHLVIGGHFYCHDEFEVEGGISLVAARIGGEVRFSGSTLTHENGVALCADRLVVEKDMYCRNGLVIRGEVSLRGAHVQGKLDFSTATISNRGGTALQADQLTVGSDFCCDEGFTAEGMVELTDVHVLGELSFSDAALCCPGHVALLAPRLIVDKDMFCRDKFVVQGTVCLIGAHIGGRLSLTGAHLTGASLTDDQLCDTSIEMMVTGGVEATEASPAKSVLPNGPLARGCRALTAGSRRLGDRVGKLGRRVWMPARRTRSFLVSRLWGQRPTRRMTPRQWPDSIVSGASGLALIADGMRVEADMTCDGGFTAYGEIRLKRARIGKNLDFSDAEVNNVDGTALSAEDVQADRMLMPAKCLAGRISLRYGKMVELDDKRGVRPDQIDITGLSYETLIPPLDPETRLEWLAKNDYEPQPYDQLARSYRQLGHEDKARTVQLAEERRRRETLSGPRKLWGYLQDATIGYGYRTGRAAMLFTSVVLLGTVVFWFWRPTAIEPTSVHQFNSFFYTLDTLIPFADFGQRDHWISTGSQELFRIFLALCGWTLAITAIAWINRKLTRS